MLSTLQVDSGPAEPPGMPQNTGVGSLSILPGDLPDPGIKPGSPALQADSSPAELPGKPPGEVNAGDSRSVPGPGRSHVP